jgi:hypothetical protein
VIRVTFQALVVRVLIASPSDAGEARDRIERTVREWNAARAVAAGVILEPVRWETHGIPELGADAQSVLNEQIVDACDIVMAIFDARVGTATARAVSGTVEEIQRAHGAGRPVHVWFSTAPLPRDVDTGQLDAVRELQRSLPGLIGEYADLNDLAYRVRTALDRDVDRLAEAEKVDFVEVFERGLRDTGPGGPSASSAVREPLARLRARVTERGRGGIAVSIANSGSAPAEDLSVKFISESGQELQADGPQHLTLLDGTEATWRMWLSIADTHPRTVKMTWIEGGDARTLDQTISG